jgi:hypothetical protein
MTRLSAITFLLDYTSQLARTNIECLVSDMPNNTRPRHPVQIVMSLSARALKFDYIVEGAT